MAPSAEFIVGVLGNVTGVALFLAPFHTFVRIFNKKSTDAFSATPYLCALLNCLLWLLYGLPLVTKHSVLVMTINGIGALLEFSYLSIFMRYAPKSGKIRTLQVGGVIAAFFILVVAVVIFAFPHIKTRHMIVGVLCVFITIIMCAAPLSAVRLVIQTKSVEYMPLPLSVMVFLNSVAWTAYAFLKNDIYIMIPNIFGVALGITQLVIYGCYYRFGKSKLQQKIEMRHKAEDQVRWNVESDVSTSSDIDLQLKLDSNSVTPQVSTAGSQEACGRTSAQPPSFSLPMYSTVSFSTHCLNSKT